MHKTNYATTTQTAQYLEEEDHRNVVHSDFKIAKRPISHYKQSKQKEENQIM